MFFLIQGIKIGLLVAAPPGPVGILCIRQTLTYGVFAGLFAGLAASIADGFYSCIASLSAGYVNKLMEKHGEWFYLIGGCFLVYLGLKFILSKVDFNKTLQSTKPKHLLSSFSYTFFLSLASPMTTFLFIGWFTATGIFEHSLTGTDIVHIIIGVFCGAMFWWVILVGIVHVTKKKLRNDVFHVLNKASGTAILGYGLYTLTKLI
jgi:threonine/homoserine/homoserine lactone efflux protein